MDKNEVFLSAPINNNVNRMDEIIEDNKVEKIEVNIGNLEEFAKSLVKKVRDDIGKNDDNDLSILIKDNGLRLTHVQDEINKLMSLGKISRSIEVVLDRNDKDGAHIKINHNNRSNESKINMIDLLYIYMITLKHGISLNINTIKIMGK